MSSNTQTAIEFLTMCASGQVRQAYDRFVADDFQHHNAYFPSDRESLLKAMEQSAQAEPNKSFTARQTIEQGDRVAVLSHLQREEADIEYAVVHIARFHEGKIVELWDIVQQIPAGSPNKLGMF